MGQAASLDAAHDVLEAEVRSVEGVRAAWPVHMDFASPNGSGAASARPGA